MTRPVLVTGATGHLGANVVRRLLDDGKAVRVLLQPGLDQSAVDGLEVERVFGDIRSLDDMRKATKGCERIFHTAAKISTLNSDQKEMRLLYDINVLGTRNVLEAAKENDCGRVVVTGSFSAIGWDLEDPTKPIGETMPHYPFVEMLPYSRSKVLTEYECLRAVTEGQDVVIATSCAIIGPNDFVPSRLGRTLCDFANGTLRAYIPGGFMFVAAKDITEGHMLAMDKGRNGQKYIFASEYLSMDDMIGLFEEITGTRRPRLRLPRNVMYGIVTVHEAFMTTFFPKAPLRITPHAVRILGLERRADTTKAQTELGFKPTKMRDAIQDAYEFFSGLGWITKRRAA